MAEKELTLKEKARALINESVNAQNQLFDEIVLPNLDNEDDTVVTRAHKTYMEKLGGFDAKAFRKCMDKLRNEVSVENPELFSLYADKFSHIPEYITHRNNYNEKVKNISKEEESNEIKQVTVKALDMNRTRAHNGVIDLFNTLNEFADKNRIAKPYPNNGRPFNPQSIMDRAHVADVLKRQETLFETFEMNIANERTTESHYEKMRNMNLKELQDYYKNCLSVLNKGEKINNNENIL